MISCFLRGVAVIIFIIATISNSDGAANHVGKVISAMESGEYTYIEYEENSKKSWVAVAKTRVAVGDVIEFPDNPPMLDFESRTVDRKFDSIIFAPGIVVIPNPGSIASLNSSDPMERAIVREINEEWDKAVEEYSKAIAQNPTAAEPYYRRGRVYENVDPRHRSFDETNGNVKGYEDKIRKQIEDYTSASNLDPGNDEYRFVLANALKDVGDYEAAILSYQILVKKEPKKAMYHSILGKCYSTAQQYELAIKSINTALELENHPQYLRDRGDARGKLNRIDEAISDYNAAYMMGQGGVYWVSNSLSQAYIRNKRYQEAISFYSKALKKFPKVPEIYRDRAAIHMARDEFGKAVSDYNSAIKLETGNAFYYSSRAEAYQGLKRWTDAKNDLVFAYQKEELLCPNLAEFRINEARGWHWKRYARGSNQVTFFYNTKEITKVKNIFRLWIRYEEPEESETVMGNTYPEEKLSHSVALVELNCSTKESRDKSVINYGVKGASRSYNFEKPPFEPIPPDSVTEELYNNLCKKL